MAKQDDGLFLLEVLIDKIIYSKTPCFSDKGFRTCVTIQCPACDPLDICDDDPGTNRVTANDSPFVKSFNNGKSCLFSLKQADIANAMSKFPIKVSVYKELPCGCLPTKIHLGEATIDMTKEFVEARKKFLEDPNNVSYQALKDSFRIMGTDGVEAGEILMFLRISCFGKLIVTRFQGSGAPPMLGSGMGSSGPVDRSCNPPRGFQSRDDPCACGASRAGGGGSAGGSRGGAGGVCEPARDPYNTMPCEDPDDPCYCSGPKPDAKQQMACRNTQQYCLHVPKGAPLSTPLHQDSSEEQKQISEVPSWRDPSDLIKQYFNTRQKYQNTETALKDDSDRNLCPIASTVRSKKRSVSFIEIVNYIWKKNNGSKYNPKNMPNVAHESKFGKKETTVYMTLYDQFCRHRTSGTQATASINKSFQASAEQSLIQYQFSPAGIHSGHCSTCPMYPKLDDNINNKDDARCIHHSEMYFFSRKRRNTQNVVNDEETGKIFRSSKSVQAQSVKNSISAQTPKRPTGCSSGTTTSKAVSIKEPDKTCPFKVTGTGNDGCSLTATVSHIRIGPRLPCGVHGTSPCQGPNCIMMGLGPCADAPTDCFTPGSNSNAQKAPVKVSAANNPRRGVFELVIRRLNGAPLARNELMLEWTPPPTRGPCDVPCPLICSLPAMPGPCRPAKCKMPVYRTSKPRCCKKPLRCKFPCGPKLYQCMPCSLCGRVSCPGCPANPCAPGPCAPPPCTPRPCSPRPCAPKPCARRPCTRRPCTRRPCAPRPCAKPCRPCKPCKPCKPCYPPFPFKPSNCTLCCTSLVSPCKPCKPCKPCRRCKPPPAKPCRPCFPYRPCVPDLACPMSRTSIVFSPRRPKTCQPCDPCSPCSPFPSCFSCYPCIPATPYSPCLRFPSSPCIPRNICDSCNKPCHLNTSCIPCSPPISIESHVASDPCIPTSHCRRCCTPLLDTSKSLGCCRVLGVPNVMQ